MDETTVISRRRALACLGAWSGASVLWGLSGGVPKAFGMAGDASTAAAAKGAVHLRADQRHARRLQQGSQSRCDRHDAPCHRRSQCVAATAGVRCAHRRHHAPFPAGGVRARERSAAGAARRPHPLRAGRARRARQRTRGVSARPRGRSSVLQLRRSRRAFRRAHQRGGLQGRQHADARRRAARVAGEGSALAVRQHAHRRARAHPAVDGL